MFHFFRHLLDGWYERCDHEWEREQKMNMNEFIESEDEEDEEEIVSPCEYSLLRCKHCKAFKYHKVNTDTGE